MNHKEPSIPCLCRRQAAKALALLPLMGLSARAQTVWPSKTGRIVVPYPGGGSPDTFARSLAEQMGALTGQSFIIENKPGASGLLGARAVSQGTMDGHSLAYITSGHVTLQAMNPAFNLLKDLKPVCKLSASTFVCVVHPKSPYKTMQDLVVGARSNPGKLSFGSAGPGSPAHIAVALLEEKLPGFKGLHVPFKGAVESINAIMGEQIDFSILVMGAAAPHIQSGKLRALGVTSSARNDAMPDVPTIAASVAPGYAYESWGGIAMHAQTPDQVVEKVFQVLTKAVRTPQLAALMDKTGSHIDLSASVMEFNDLLARDITNETRLVKSLGLTAGS